MSTIRLLDISGLFWPVWRKKEAMGRPIGEAAAETVQALRERAAANDADYVVACCDAGRSFRWEIAEEYRAMLPDYPGYKSHRPVKDPAMMAALSRVIEELRADGVPIMQAPGFEADDCIATLTCWAVEHGHDVEIVSDDKDLRQLIVDPDPDNEHSCSVRVVERDGTVHNEASVLAQFGVPPQRLGAWLALAGDTSDGIKGVPDIGEKTASALLYGRYDDEKKWHPTPFMSFKQAVEAAQADQETVDEQERTLADIREGREVRKLAKQGMSDGDIADKLKTAVATVLRHKATVGPEKLPTFPKPRFKESTRKALLGGSQWFDISYRLTLLRRDVPLDFAQVTAPRVPPRDPAKDAELDSLLRAATADANEEEQRAIETAVLAAKEQEAMTTQATTATIADAEFTETKAPAARQSEPEAAQVSAPPPAQAAVPANGAKAPEPKKDALAPIKLDARPFELQLEPRTLVEADWLAKVLASSRSKLKDLTDPGAVILKMAVGRSLGLNLYQSLRLDIIEGRIAMPTNMILARVKSSPLCEYIVKKHGDDKSCTWITKRRGDKDPQENTFTLEEALLAQLGGSHKSENNGDFDRASNWVKWRKAMLSARAVLPLMREVYPEIAGGCYSPDELADGVISTSEAA